MRETIATLSSSLGDGLGRLVETAHAQSPRQTADPELLRKLVESLRPTEPHVRVVGEDGSPHASPTSITVVNKIPPTLLNVLREQFRLMETWLKPMLAASHRQSDEIEELEQQLKICLADYERLVGRIESTRSDGR